MAREPAGRSMHDVSTETREMAEADRRTGEQKAAPYLLVVAALFVIVAVILFLTR